MSAKVTLNSQFAQGIATNLASDGALTKQIVLPPGNGHLMAIQFQGREESLFVIPNYFTSKPKYCFLLAHVSLLPIIIYPTKLMCFTQEGVQQTLQSHNCYYFAFLQKYASSVEGSWKKRHRSSYFPPQSPLQRQSKALMTLRPKRWPQNISHKYVIHLVNVKWYMKWCTNCFLWENLSKWTVQTLYWLVLDNNNLFFIICQKKKVIRFYSKNKRSLPWSS